MFLSMCKCRRGVQHMPAISSKTSLSIEDALSFQPEIEYFYTPETKFGGVYRSHPVVGRLVGRAVQRSVAFSFSNTTSYNDQAHGEKVQCTRRITPSWLITELLPFVTFPCPERNLKSTSWISKQFHTMVNHNMWKCSAQEP